MQTVLFKIFKHHFQEIYHVLQTVIGLYQVARQCRRFYAPKHKSKTNKQGLSQQLTQTMPPTDKCIPGLQTRPILVLMEPSPPLVPSTPQTLALQQDRAMDKFAPEPVSESLTPTEDRSSDNKAPIQQVRPLLGTTHRENLQLRTRNSPEDISDVLGTIAYQGYVNTLLQTLDSIVVNQPKRFLPLAEEA